VDLRSAPRVVDHNYNHVSHYDNVSRWCSVDKLDLGIGWYND
jgi:hypothetical protein